MPRGRRRASAPEPPDHYATLGVASDADHSEIKRAYRALALKHHPDKSSEASATATLAAINCAWDVVGDEERRRTYDMQREADGEARAASMLRRRGPFAAVRKTILGSADRRSFAWSSGMMYLHRHSLRALHDHLRRGRSALLFLHLGGSPRAAKAVPAMLEAYRRLHGAVLVAAVDVEAEPELARSLSPGGEAALPAAVLITAEAGARLFAPPLEAAALVEAAVSTLHALPRVCTSGQLKGMLSTALGHPRQAAVLVAAQASAAVLDAVRIASASRRSLLAAKVTHRRCALPEDVMACDGVALLWSKDELLRSSRSKEQPAAASGHVRRCVASTEPEQIAAALRAHEATAAQQPRAVAALRGGFRAAARVVVDSTPAKVAVAAGGALRGAPLGRAVDAVLGKALDAAVQAQAPLAMLAAGLLVWAVRAVALGGPLPWARRRGSGGRRLGRSSRARRRSSAAAKRPAVVNR